MTTMTKETCKLESCTLGEIRCAIAAIEDKKGEAIRVLDVRGKSPITAFATSTLPYGRSRAVTRKGSATKDKTWSWRITSSSTKGWIAKWFQS